VLLSQSLSEVVAVQSVGRGAFEAAREIRDWNVDASQKVVTAAVTPIDGYCSDAGGIQAGTGGIRPSAVIRNYGILNVWSAVWLPLAATVTF
jgi:hypothetical protein